MWRRIASPAFVRPLTTMSSSMTPLEDALRAKVRSPCVHCIALHSFVLISQCAMINIRPHQITQELKPTALEIFNDSHKHAHHKAMAGSTSRETHFRYCAHFPCQQQHRAETKGKQSQHCFRSIQVKDAACKTPYGVWITQG